MSQAGISSMSGGVAPAIETLTPDSGGIVSPVANNINVFSKTSTVNLANGIQTVNGGAGELDIQLTNRAVGSGSTTGAVSANIITLALGATPGVYTFDISVAGFAKTGVGSPAGCGYTIVGSVRTDGATATLVPFQAVDHFEEAVLQAPQPTAVLAVSGNNALVTVNGKSDGAAGFVIDWNATLLYTFAS
jgi:hypothetical protein